MKFVEKVRGFVCQHKGLTSAVAVGSSVVAAVAPACHAEGEASLVNVTSTMLTPITSSITSNLGVLLPVGIGIMAVMIGVSLIPRIVYKFF